MSQTGYTPIQIYYSTTAAAVPVAANLVSGELAINITDGKLYYKDNGGVVQVIAGKGGAGVAAGSNTQLQFNNNGVFGASSGLTWDGSYLTASSIKDSALTSGRVTYAGTSGLLQDSANLTFNGTTLTAGGLTTTGTTSTGVLSVTGNSTLGTNSSNTLAVNALVNSNLLFTDATYDIGASGATRPRNLYLGGTVLSLSNSSSVSTSLVSSAGEATLVLDAATSGTNNSNAIRFKSSGTDKWILGGGNVGTADDFDFTLYNYATSKMVFNVPTGDNAVNFYGKIAVNTTSGAGAITVLANSVNGHSIFSVNDATLNYSSIYFGGTTTSGYQGIRADGRSTGWLRFLTNDTQRLNIDYLGAGTFYGTTWEFNQSYPYMNNIYSGSVKPMMFFNTAGTYYAGFYDSGLTGAAGSRQYFARTSGIGVAPSSVLLALDYQNNRVGIGTINPISDLQVSNPNGGASTLTVKSISSGGAVFNLDSYTNSGGTSTQIGFSLNGSAKWAFGYANIGASGPNDMGIYDYGTAQTPWIMTSTDYQRLPRTVAFMASISANYISSGVSVVNFNTTTATGCFDNRGNFDTGNYRFVAPVDGWYQFNVVVNQYSVSGTFFEITLRKNASVNYAGGRIYSGGSSDQNITTTAVLYLSQNDYVDVVSQQGGGFSANTRWNTFSGHLIG